MSEFYLWQPELLVLCLAEDPLLLGVLKELEIHSHIPPLNVEHEVKIKGGGTFVDVKNIQYLKTDGFISGSILLPDSDINV